MARPLRRNRRLDARKRAFPPPLRHLDVAVVACQHFRVLANATARAAPRGGDEHARMRRAELSPEQEILLTRRARARCAVVQTVLVCVIITFALYVAREVISGVMRAERGSH